MKHKRRTFLSLRLAAGFQTRQALAESTQVSPHTLWRWECGQVPKRNSTLIALVARKLKLTPEDLLEVLTQR